MKSISTCCFGVRFSPFFCEQQHFPFYNCHGNSKIHVTASKTSVVNTTAVCVRQLKNTLNCHFFFFFLNFLYDISPFCGATDTPVWDFWWRLLRVPKPCSLTFTSGATPADLLAASKAAKLFSSTYLQTGIGGVWNQDLSCHHWRSTDWATLARHCHGYWSPGSIEIK